ncbi:hypothetical protein M427DRAFT_130860 [Gonapodya prolifera JEL478]|uniref:Centrosomal protein of 70 kDa n=1 Tax=Gonapodya prolifera (strain JEL478) TaxID=1344416 RepID=A0A139AXE2_GONPJ|nr:hypothetical protein M427DRAFT_130860 [Gonapodya prolifera JEL478]|eukprot:KXS21374.1 hypothetical protein M427DRAFT_130860 [Gonapodya prolifera JEL478]
MKVQAADRIAREVASAYEARMAAMGERVRLLEAEVGSLKKKLGEAEKRAKVGAEEAAQREVEDAKRRADEAEDRWRRAEAGRVRAEGELEAEREEKEVLKLRLLERKGGDGAQAPPSGLTTRDLIRRDKIAHGAPTRLLTSFASLPPDAAISLLAQVSSLLGVSDPSAFISGVRDVARVVRALPDVQRFVKEVDDVVWEDDDADGKMHKLVETAKKLREWKADVRRAKKLEVFRRRVYRHLGIEPRESDIAALDEIDRSLSARLANGGSSSAESARLVAHFQSLFDVPNESGVQAAMDRLYTQTSVFDAAVRRLRSTLGREGGSVTAVVDEACRVIKSWRHMEAAMEKDDRSGIESSDDEKDRFESVRISVDGADEGDEALRELGKLVGRARRT